MKNFAIAIDGPAGAGKSTIAKRAAKELGFIYVDTGAMYRAIALSVIKSGMDYNDSRAVSDAVKNIDITICYEDGIQQVICNGENVTGELRNEEVGNAASVVSTYPAVRNHLLNLQRNMAAENSVIMDGRDIGTCILPGADLKIFLTASSKVRAQRRCKELAEKGKKADPEEIEKEINERDERDSHRETAPLKMADDAVLIDSSDMTVEEVTGAILKEAAARGI